jgi:hypothetical protein
MIPKFAKIATRAKIVAVRMGVPDFGRAAPTMAPAMEYGYFEAMKKIKAKVLATKWWASRRG